MSLTRRSSDKRTETEKLAAARAALPQRVAEWTPEQRRAFTAQSDEAMREQNR
ncbi:hypothetical protein ACFW91_25005 [Streptomyces asoensis]|uniref:hypothetical protein n=1 Tax=Streptomyces asoensis TaxID=249586 RepID=UPI00367B5500